MRSKSSPPVASLKKYFRGPHKTWPERGELGNEERIWRETETDDVGAGEEVYFCPDTGFMGQRSNRLGYEAQRSGKVEIIDHIVMAVLFKLNIGAWADKPEKCSYRDVRKAVSYQTSCFSKTTVMKITPHKYPLTDIEPILGIAFSEAWHFSGPACYQPSIEWQCLENTASYSQVPPTIVGFPYQLWNLRCWNGSSVSIEINFHHSYNVLIHEIGLRISNVWTWSDFWHMRNWIE